LKLSLGGVVSIFFGVAFPIIVATILGIIYNDKPAFEGAEYTFLDQSFGAIAAIGICAAGVMGLPLVISDYRHKKILKRFKVTPVSPAMLIFVQVVINFIYSMISLILVYLVSALFFGVVINGSPIGFFGSYLLVVLSIYSIGIMVASISPDIRTCNVLCSILYFPMLIFSGATLPYELMPPVLQKMSDFMPLTQGIKLLKGTFLGLPFENIFIPIVIMVTLSLVCIGVSLKLFKWE